MVWTEHQKLEWKVSDKKNKIASVVNAFIDSCKCAPLCNHFLQTKIRVDGLENLFRHKNHEAFATSSVK